MSAPAQTLVTPLARPRSSGLGRLLHNTWTLYRRAMIQMVHNPTQLYFSIIQPLIWFLLFGQVFSRLTTGFGAAPTGPGGANPVTQQFGTDNYQAFFLPAIIVQMVLFGATGSALGIITDDLNGYLNKLRVAPIDRFSILIGGLLANLTRMFVQTLLLLVIGIVFGVRPAYWYLLPLIFVFIGLFGLVIGGLGLIIGLKTRNVQSTFLLVNFFTLPLFFTSSAQLPITFLPDWLQTVAKFNPLTYAINAVRVIITGLNKSQMDNGDTVFTILLDGGIVLLVLAVIVLFFATRIFSKQIAK